jgi:hypothetical protein
VVCMATVGAAEASIDTNGGASWGGWTSYGSSDAAGIFGTGSNTTVYEIYQTVFTFDNNTMSLGAGYTGNGFAGGQAGQFANGNLIYGLGVRRVSGTGTLGLSTVFFDAGNDTIQAANAPGGARVSSSSWAQDRDFTVQFGSSGASQISLKLGDGTSFGGTSTFLASGNGAGQAPFGFRSAGNGDNRQMFFDLTYMNSVYTQANWFGIPGWTGTNTLGDFFRVSLDNGGMGARTAINSIQVPAPGAFALIGLAGLAGKRRRR